MKKDKYGLTYFDNEKEVIEKGRDIDLYFYAKRSGDIETIHKMQDEVIRRGVDVDFYIYQLFSKLPNSQRLWNNWDKLSDERVDKHCDNIGFGGINSILRFFNL